MQLDKIQVTVRLEGVNRSVTIDITEQEYIKIMSTKDFRYIQEAELNVAEILIQSLEVNGNVHNTWLTVQGELNFESTPV